MRRLVGVLVAALALVGAGLGSRAVDVSRADAVRAETDRAAQVAVQSAADALSELVTDLKLKVENAAANPRLVFALQGNVDERTMRDLWRTEDWWRPWRTEFKVYAVAMNGTQVDVVEGIDAAELDSESLLRRVRERGEGAAEIILGKGWPYAAAATAVHVPAREKMAVLLLAKPLDEASLRRLADKAKGAVVLSNGRRSLIDAGPQTEKNLLAQAIGNEKGGGTFHAADSSWSAASVAVAPGLWLWAFTSAGAAAHDAEATASERKAMLWVSGLVIAAAALLLAARRQTAAPPAAAGAPLPGTLPGLWAGSSPISDAGVGTTSLIPEAGLASTASSSLPALGTGAQRLPGAIPSTMPTASAASGGVDGRAATAVASPPPPVHAVGIAGSGAVQAEAPFGRYTLLDRLGQGGMAEVYTAVTFGAQGFRRKFVIKRLRAELARDPAAVDQFIDEANLASSMVHSNIVPVFDFGKVGEEYFMAQEYILGRDLARVTRRRLELDQQPLPPEVVLHAAHETLRALEYAHTKTDEHGQPLGIVHRDVSPANVIVSARGEVKLFDFGIVKAQGRVTKTESGIVKGNVTFMSPEQARGIAVDARADLFSLGLLLYYCLTGKVLYTGNTTYELLVKAATGPDTQEHASLDALPAPCGPLLRRALQVDPEHRFQTAREFGEAVSGHVGGGAGQLAKLMDHLFSEDFRAEELRFRSAAPVGPGGGAPSGGADPEPPHRS